MPSQPRIDIPGLLHHVRVRGIECGLLFRSDGDREDFLDRLRAVCEEDAAFVYAWCLTLIRQKLDRCLPGRGPGRGGAGRDTPSAGLTTRCRAGKARRARELAGSPPRPVPRRPCKEHTSDGLRLTE